MHRSDAISLLAERELSEITEEKRASLLLAWWSIDEEDEAFHSLPELLRAELRQRDEPDGTRKPYYDPLLRLALRRAFLGVRNEYLEMRLSLAGHVAPVVEGAVEVLEACPCCGFRTLSEPRSYEICRVCFWEDDFARELDVASGPNHMTLREARRNFLQIGAVSQEALANVLPDGQLRYLRA